MPLPSDPAHNRIRAAQDLLRARDLAGARRQADAALPFAADADIVARNALGSVFYELGELNTARSLFQSVLSENPRYADALNNLGNILARDGKPRAALEFYERALQAGSTHPDYLANLGGVRQALGDVAGALQAFEQALTVDPAHADARWNRGLARLLSGDLAGGFSDYEARWSLPEFRARVLPSPRWSGQDVGGKTILIHSEQGYGDTIMMVRFAAVLSARGANVIVETHATLAPLMRSVDGVALAIAHGEPLPPFDFHLPMMSLPYACGIASIEDIPAPRSYIAVPGRAALVLPPALSQDRAGEKRVGVVWAGRPTHRNDRNRSLGSAQLAPLAATAGVRLFSLQIGAAPADLAHLPGIVDLGPQLADFTATAGILEQLDLVISVDTAVAHLAGAMGKECWVMLPFAPDWRWLQTRTDSVWYPSLRLYRQPRIGDWASVVAAVRDDLAAR